MPNQKPLNNKEKIFKDPLYGYISVSYDFVDNFVDTAVFQRLRRIVQTSYSPLYAATLHNRFIHSLGVYHLGRLAFDSMRNSLNEAVEKHQITDFHIEEYKELFLAACLLHDVGHAPFSHIGEEFYERIKGTDWLDKQFWAAAGIKSKYRSVIPSERAAAHELMSVIVALRVYKFFFRDKDREFFARCITGYKYDTSLYDQKCKYLLQLKNYLISILRSDSIDVDRLDYLIRDSFVSGYQNVSIDYKRLLNGLMVVYDKAKDEYLPVFHKNAISVIESVIFAHDSEKKWIQNHPVICYESEIIRYAIEKVLTHFGSENIFCYEALTEKGITVNTTPPVGNGYKLSLLSDTEILFFIKNIIPEDEFINEFFDRTKRRSALWKSEVEFTQLNSTKLSGDVIDSAIQICGLMNDIFKYRLSHIPPVINRKSLKEAEILLSNFKDQDELFEDRKQAADKISLTAIDKNRKNTSKKGISNFIEYCKCFEKFARKSVLSFDIGFLILMPKKFKSGFAREITDKIRIWFPMAQRMDFFTTVTSTLSPRQNTEANTQSEETEVIYFYTQKIKDDDTKRKLQEDFISFLGNELKVTYDRLT